MGGRVERRGNERGKSGRERKEKRDGRERKREDVRKQRKNRMNWSDITQLYCE